MRYELSYLDMSDNLFKSEQFDTISDLKDFCDENYIATGDVFDTVENQSYRLDEVD